MKLRVIRDRDNRVISAFQAAQEAGVEVDVVLGKGEWLQDVEVPDAAVDDPDRLLQRLSGDYRIKLQVVRDAKKRVVAAFDPTQQADVQISPVLKKGQTIQEVEVRAGETFDPDALLKKLNKK